MKNKEYWKEWITKAGIRALKTVAQSFTALIGTAVIMQDVNWAMVLSGSLLSGIMSLAMSVGGLPEIETVKEVKEK